MTDVKTLSDSELFALEKEIADEKARRAVLQQAIFRVNVLQLEFLTARDGAQPQIDSDGVTVDMWSEWVLPDSAPSQYPPGYIVRLGDRLYRNDAVSSSVSEPGTTGSGWLDITEELKVGE